MSMETAVSVLAQFGESIGIPGLVFDEKNACCLVFDADILVNIGVEERNGRLVLFSYLGDLPQESRARQCAAMLEGNFFWQGTSGATLCLEAASRSALLMQPVLLKGLNASLFHDTVETFVNTAEHWIGRLRVLTGTTEDYADRPSLQSPSIGLRV